MDPQAPDRASNGELLNRVHKLRLDGQLGSGKTIRGGTTWLPWTLCILLAVTWAGVGIRGYKNSPAPSPVAATSETPAASTPTTGTPPPTAGSVALTLKGYLIPSRTIAVSPIDVAGRVVELNIVEGKKYKKGDVLAKIEDTSYVALVDESKAALSSAMKKLDASKARLAALLPASVRPIEVNQIQEELKEAEAQKTYAQGEFERITRLGLVASAEKELNQAKYDYSAASAKVLRLQAALAILKDGPRKGMKDAAEADVQSADAEVNAAKARLVQSQWRLDNCIIRAPIDGTVLEKKAELYNLVNPLAFAATSGSVCDMADLASMEVDVEVGEREIAKLANVKSCRIVADAYPGRPYKGKLDRIMPVIIRANNVVKVRVKLELPDDEEPGTYLKPNMGAAVTFLADK